MPRTIALAGRSLVPSVQPDGPMLGSAPAASPDGLDAGPDLSARKQEVRCVMCLLLV